MPLHHPAGAVRRTVQLNAAGQVDLKLKTPWRDGTTHLVMSQLEFMQRLAALVPRPRLHLIRFHGVLAPNAKLRPLVVPHGPPAQAQVATEAAAVAEREVETVQAGPGRTASAGRGFSSASSTSTCSTARTAAPGNCRSSQPSSSGRSSRRSSPTWGWIRSRLPGAARARRGKTEATWAAPAAINTCPWAATPNRSRGGVARPVSAAPSESGSTLRTSSPASVMSAEGPTKAAMRDVTVAKSRHLRPPQDRHRSTWRAFENTMRCAHAIGHDPPARLGLVKIARDSPVGDHKPSVKAVETGTEATILRMSRTAGAFFLSAILA